MVSLAQLANVGGTCSENGRRGEHEAGTIAKFCVFIIYETQVCVSVYSTVVQSGVDSAPAVQLRAGDHIVKLR